MALVKTQVATLLLGLEIAIRFTAKRYPGYRERLKEKNLIAQIKLKDESQGRYYIFKDGKINSKAGLHPNPDIAMIFETAELALLLMKPDKKQLDLITAMKNFQVANEGPDELFIWFSETLQMIFTSDIEFGGNYGIDMGNGVKRYTNNTNGGPVFVYVKDDKIIRITPMEFDKDDADPWTIEAKGKRLTPPKKTTVNAHTLAWKSAIYSPDRLLYPLKRVDFDPNGERNPQNRGVSGYERISWDEAYNIVAGEIARIKTTYGPGAMMCGAGSHHNWGHIGYWLSARKRFVNTVGITDISPNPDSWEGMYWGATHHWGQSGRLGGSEQYGTVEDCLKNSEMVVFWSSDPESTSGVYGAHEGTVRRQWLKELGIKTVHIDPYYNHTAALIGGKWLAPRPGTDSAMVLAIAYVWMTEDLYDKEYVATRTVGFEKFLDYVLGNEDGIPKTPEWQESESGVPAKDVRALAREWGSKRTYLAAGGLTGFGGAGRTATGTDWARGMVCLIGMQGFGKPGVNMGGLQDGTPLDTRFFFPGYAEGGISGDVVETGNLINLYQRMPMLPTMSPVTQRIPRLKLPEAIMEGKAEWYIRDPKSIEGQFARPAYPAPGYPEIKMYYRYGSSHIGTMVDTNRYVKMYRSDKLEFVVNQSIWKEGEVEFADIILPACTNFERFDISEFAHAGGFLQYTFTQCNHRVLVFQHKCIEPLGESKSDYEIFKGICKKLELAAAFSEGDTELGWIKRMFDATDLARVKSYKDFVKKGYYVVPPPSEKRRDPVAFRWFYEGRAKDTPELTPLPASYAEKWRYGLQTQSGKLEFESSSLKRYDPHDPERAPILRYVPSWEGRQTTELLAKYPLQLLSPHPRYSFHTHTDGKDSFINDIKNHRVLVNDYYYWIARINTRDAVERGIKENDLVEIFNDRGSVICAAQLTERVPAGIVHSYASSAIYKPVGEPGKSTDIGGCVNLLTPSRMMIKKSHAMAANSCLVQIKNWSGKDVPE
jgi:trimethylamine-N-oxide reductase (cytochrome c)